jgi:hypothetical protein
VVFWVVTHCRLVGDYKRYGGTCYLYLQGSRPTDTLVNTHKISLRHNPEDHNPYSTRYKNLSSSTMNLRRIEHGNLRRHLDRSVKPRCSNK